MGILDFFKSNPKKKTEVKPNPKREVINSYEKLKQETDRLKNENKLWQKEYNKSRSFNTKAAQLEKDGEYFKSIQIYLKAIEHGRQSSKLSVNNFANDIKRVIILYGKIKDKENQKSFLEEVLSLYPDYRDAKKWAVRLSKLKDLNNSKPDLKPSDIRKQVAGIPTLGGKYESFKNSLPEFNFYYDMPEGMQTFQYLGIRRTIPLEKSKELRNIKDAFEIILSKAKIAENEGDFKTAIEAYEKLIVEEFDGKQPFERLMIIYRKLKWIEQEIDVTQRAVTFFDNLRQKQKSKVLSLAKKYDMESKALEYIDGNKKIQYYGGAFDLYCPYPIIDKWKTRLEKSTKR